MKIGIMYVLHGRKTSIPQKLSDIVKEFSDTLDLPASDRYAGRATTDIGGSAVTELEKQTVDKIVVVPVMLFPATHAREYPAAHASLRSRSVRNQRDTRDDERCLRVAERSIAESCRAPPNFADHAGRARNNPLYGTCRTTGKDCCCLEMNLGREVFATNHLGEPHYQAISGEHPEHRATAIFYRWILAKKIGVWFEKNRPQDVLLEQLLDAEAVHAALKERLEDAGCIR